MKVTATFTITLAIASVIALHAEDTALDRISKEINQLISIKFIGFLPFFFIRFIVHRCYIKSLLSVASTNLCIC